MKAQQLVTFAALAVALALAFTAATRGSSATTRIDTGTAQPPAISVNGEGKTTAAPDLAMVTLGVSTLRGSVAQARDDAATAMDAMVRSMRNNGVAEKDIQTQQLSISPEYDYSGNRQVLRGFRVSNTVAAKVRDINRTSAVVDDAVTAGGDEVQVQGISFTIDRPEELRRQAREKAVQDARARAETLASSSGVSLGAPLAISETGYTPGPVAFQAAGKTADSVAAAPATPVQTGELDVTVQVSVSWEIKS